MKNPMIAAAAILSALRGTDGGPESALYLACGMTDPQALRLILGPLVSAGLIEEAHHWIRLTPAGEALAAKIDAAVAGSRGRA